MEKRYMKASFNIMPMIEERIQYLEQIKEKLEVEYKKMPDGNILIAPGGSENYYRYYLRKSPKEKMGTYLDASEYKAKQLYSSKKYYMVSLKEIDEELKKLMKIRSMNPQDSIMVAFNKVNPGIRKIIQPVNIDDETFIKIWMSESYEGLGFTNDDKTSFYSDCGERMRSKSELLIANMLFKLGIPYKYECPIITDNGKTLYPDFTILDVKRRKIKYWEHLGKMGDLSYVGRNLWKLDEYRKMDILLGINLFITYENETNAIRSSDITKTIESIFGG